MRLDGLSSLEIFNKPIQNFVVQAGVDGVNLLYNIIGYMSYFESVVQQWSPD